MSIENDPIDVVQRYHAYRLAGDTSAAKALWADGAMWHLTGSHTRAGDYSFDDYMDMIAEWVAAFPGYSAEVLAWSEVGDLAYATVRSRGGETPSAAEGLIVYRVVGGRIAEGWAIPSDPRYGF